MRRLLTGAVLIVVPLGVAPATATAATPRAVADATARASCPAAESLVPHAHWHRHTLARGIRLSQAQVHDSRGVVSLHVLRLRLTVRGVHVSPLATSLADRRPLSELAAGRPHLVAATNTGYFDFITGAPTGPFINRRVGEVISTRHQAVAGIGVNGRAEAGQVWLRASISTPHGRHRVDAVNELHPPTGLSLFTRQWGSRAVALHGGVARYVSSRRRTSSLGHYDRVRRSGYLLVARGEAATRTLESIGTGQQVTLSRTVRSTAASPFRQAYGVGSELVAHPGTARRGFSCDSSNTKQPARTAIGFADGGRTLVIGEVSEHPFTTLHGLDNTQMAKLMQQLGVGRAYDFDGSGSTEMLARLPHSHRLSLLTYPADGAERPMPLGLGVFD